MKTITEKKEKNRARVKLIISIIKLVLLILLIVGVPLYIMLYHSEFISQFKSLEAVNAYLEKYKTASVFAYIGIQIMQIVICIIPGQAMQFAAGYAYSFWLGYLYSIIGTAIGTVMAFYLARFLGKDAIHLIFDEKKVSRFIDKLNSKGAFILVFVIFFIPGLPKDLFTYAAGVSEMRLKAFLIISLVGRTPAMMASIMIGSMFNKGSYAGIGILAVIMTVLCIWGIKNHEKMTVMIDKWYDKLSRM
ncbi:TVP38/TMEM64 family protein [Aminipila sp.]|uniref:TVP38/TMEM64 family protein n=1 Tax=Aminipila sp. TaxID=2060095 RepID=UPI002899D70A|nr:VTT domain-containing protein [Aminipila sp.]